MAFLVQEDHFSGLAKPRTAFAVQKGVHTKKNGMFTQPNPDPHEYLRSKVSLAAQGVVEVVGVGFETRT